MGRIWWLLVILMIAFVTMLYLLIFLTSEPISPEEELRLIREQQEERLRKGGEKHD